MKIYIVVEYDSTASCERNNECVQEDVSIISAYINKENADSEAVSHNGGRFMRWEVVPVNIMDGMTDFDWDKFKKDCESK